MTYRDRQHEFSITFSDGKTYTPEFSNYSDVINHFLDKKDGLGILGTTNATDTGVSLKKIPLNLTFHGDNHDLESAECQKSASKTGDVILQPPYGKQIKCNVESIALSYSVVNDIASTRVTLEVIEVSGTKTPVGGKTQQDNIISQSSDVNASAVDQFATTKTTNEIEEASLKSYFTDSIESVNKYLRPILATTQEELTAFDATYNSIKDNIDEVISNPQLIASQATVLMALPAKIVSKAENFVAGYSALIQNQFLSPFSLNNMGKNAAINSQFFGGAAISSLSSALATSSYDNAPQAITIVEAYINIYNEYRENVDGIQEQFDISTIDLINKFIQTGVLDVPLNYLAQQTAGALISSAFDAKKEIRIQLDYETTAINIAIEYYPDRFVLDEIETLSYIINTNKLTADELILIPRRREIVVYV